MGMLGLPPRLSLAAVPWQALPGLALPGGRAWASENGDPRKSRAQFHLTLRAWEGDSDQVLKGSTDGQEPCS